ncbi:SigB/SigF/SigG family RNA polymerase sigma factor [Streptomyces sp. SID5785]|uniref:SigB/SigF/SigG family RNA polymerase sigma factor n=1 Tax=Streptomyces sp. SID5785 TaxID=2690309 RepID=UPI001360D2C3|nr:SigB/SigF/SigG family RNA polymerase sigma factor [Streptomyces sp. SID5785]MZD07131.1 SigB/SigF/SigG family RNA polymerase sigma factor [Streptomyces sp. SID5785]
MLTGNAHSIGRAAPPARARHQHDAPDTAALFARMVRLDPGTERDRLCAQIVTAWLPMAHRIARRFRDKGESTEDLEQIAALGLLKAVRRYDPRLGAFESYAVPTITGELRRHFRDHLWDLHVPRRVQELRTTVRTARRALMERPGGGEPGVAELAAHTGLTEAEVRDGLSALDSYRARSLDAELAHADRDGGTIADTLGVPDPSFDLVTDLEAVRAGLRHLPERERVILYLRFFEGMTQVRIAGLLGLSQMHVSRLIKDSCARVRSEAADPAA